MPISERWDKLWGDLTWVLRSLITPANGPFVQNLSRITTETPPKLCFTNPLCLESTGNWWACTPKILSMSCRHNEMLFQASSFLSKNEIWIKYWEYNVGHEKVNIDIVIVEVINSWLIINCCSGAYIWQNLKQKEKKRKRKSSCEMAHKTKISWKEISLHGYTLSSSYWYIARYSVEILSLVFWFNQVSSMYFPFR